MTTSIATVGSVVIKCLKLVSDLMEAKLCITTSNEKQHDDSLMLFPYQGTCLIYLSLADKPAVRSLFLQELALSGPKDQNANTISQCKQNENEVA